MTDIEERLTRDGDDGSLIERQLLSRASVEREFVRVQLKTVLRISHHCAFAGTSTMTIPGLSPVAASGQQSLKPRLPQQNKQHFTISRHDSPHGGFLFQAR